MLLFVVQTNNSNTQTQIEICLLWFHNSCLCYVKSLRIKRKLLEEKRCNTRTTEKEAAVVLLWFKKSGSFDSKNPCSSWNKPGFNEPLFFWNEPLKHRTPPMSSWKKKEANNRKMCGFRKEAAVLFWDSSSERRRCVSEACEPFFVQKRTMVQPHQERR